MRVGIVGGGIIGLAAADAIGRRGAQVTVFERAGPGAGQSGGLTRIFRHLHRDDGQTALAVEARAAWRALEQRAGRRLVGGEGVVVVGGDVDGAAGRLRSAGAPAELLNAGEVGRLLPLLGPGGPAGVLDADGGAIRVRRALECLVGLLAAGSLVREEVFAVSPKGGGARIWATEGARDFDHVVVAAGAGTAGFAAGLGVDLDERRGVHPRLMFEVRAGTVGLPCLLDRSGTHGETAYAGPVGSTSRYVVGLSADETLPVDAGATTVAGMGDFRELYARTVAYVRRALPGLDPEPVGVRLCHLTPIGGDADAFGVWERGAVTVFAGHNLMKFGPLIGECLARRVVDGADVPELTRFRPAGDERAEWSGDRRGPAVGGG